MRNNLIDKSLLFFLFFSMVGTVILIFPTFFMLITTPLHDLASATQDREVIAAISVSILTSTATTLLAIIFGVPFAYFLSRYEFKGKNIIDSLLDIPILLPHTVAGVVILCTFGPNQILGKGLRALGISLIDTIYGIILAQFFVSAPLLIKTAKAVFDSIGLDYLKAARVYGASRVRIFFEIELPMAFRGIATGALLCWARALSEFGAVIILAYYPYTAPVLVFIKFTTEGLRASKPISSLLVLVTLVIFIALRKISGEGIKYA